MVTNLATGAHGWSTFVIDNSYTSSSPPPDPLATQLAFQQQPGNAVSGANFTVLPTVAVENAGGSVLTNDFSVMSLSITSGSGTGGAALSSTCAGTESNGVFTFTNCNINMGGGYTDDDRRDHCDLRELDECPLGSVVLSDYVHEPRHDDGLRHAKCLHVGLADHRPHVRYELLRHDHRERIDRVLSGDIASKQRNDGHGPTHRARSVRHDRRDSDNWPSRSRVLRMHPRVKRT